LKFTKVGTTMPIEVWPTSSSIALPLPAATDEYNVALEDLPEGYAVKAMMYGSDDLRKGTLKLSNSAPASPFGATSPQSLSITLTHTPATPPPGARITGRSPLVGDEIYISGKPGTLYTDGTFEFVGVAPGLHSIVKLQGGRATGRAVIVRDRDVADVTLQALAILPRDVFDPAPRPVAEGAVHPAGIVSIRGRVLDSVSQEVLHHGTVTLMGYQNVQRAFAIFGDEGFRIPDLLPGAYTLTVNITGYDATSHSIVVGAEDLVLDFKATRMPGFPASEP
jgi:hypothetical protein